MARTRAGRHGRAVRWGGAAVRRRGVVWPIGRVVSRPRRGQSVVEFAFVSLTLLMLVLGVLDLGRGVFQRAMLANAAREAARHGALQPCDTAGMANEAKRRSPSLGLAWPAADFAVTYSRYDAASDSWQPLADCGAATTRDRLQIVGGYTFGLAAPRLLGLSTIRMTETVVATVQ